MKQCKHCAIELNESVKHQGYECKTCRNGIARYGLNRNQQIDLLKSQNCKCALCENVVELHVRNNQSGVIDHCHNSGKVRGVLCGACNTALGKIELIGVSTFLKNVSNYLRG